MAPGSSTEAPPLVTVTERLGPGLDRLNEVLEHATLPTS
jgi:hypothetical protein